MGNGLIAEHWTDSGRAVVVTGNRSELAHIAKSIGIPAEELVSLAPSKTALALWGAHLERYERLRTDAGIVAHPGEVDLLTAYGARGGGGRVDVLNA